MEQCLWYAPSQYFVSVFTPIKTSARNIIRSTNTSRHASVYLHPAPRSFTACKSRAIGPTAASSTGQLYTGCHTVRHTKYVARRGGQFLQWRQPEEAVGLQQPGNYRSRWACEANTMKKRNCFICLVSLLLQKVLTILRNATASQTYEQKTIPQAPNDAIDRLARLGRLKSIAAGTNPVETRKIMECSVLEFLEFGRHASGFSKAVGCAVPLRNIFF
jgi:hypothetical protein